MVGFLIKVKVYSILIIWTQNDVGIGEEKPRNIILNRTVVYVIKTDGNPFLQTVMVSAGFPSVVLFVHSGVYIFIYLLFMLRYRAYSSIRSRVKSSVMFSNPSSVIRIWSSMRTPPHPGIYRPGSIVRTLPTGNGVLSVMELNGPS